MVEGCLVQEELKAEKDLQFNYIKNRKQYLEFYRIQKKIHSNFFLVLCRKDTESSLFSVGITVTKKIEMQLPVIELNAVLRHILDKL